MGADLDPATPRYSVVVPVYNEGANIAALCRRFRQLLPPGYELVVVYDFDEDDTLPRLAALAADERPETVRLVKNEERGVRNAIVRGLEAAAGPVVFVAMADLSDDLERAEDMLTLAEGGAAVVCASRYMRGGRQYGGPLLKKTLSRLAGVSLHAFAGLPTHDPTNSFKAYRKDFLASTVVESRAGFSLALELTVKAHFAGHRIAEVPARWWHRTSGKSRFRVLHWMPEYWRWYAWAFKRRLAARRTA